MGAAVRATARGMQLGERFLRETGTSLRETRIGLGLSQAFVATAAGISRIRYGRAEAGRLPSLTILEFARIAAVLGLDPSLRLYPGGSPVRDSAHARVLRRIFSGYFTELPRLRPSDFFGAIEAGGHPDSGIVLL